MISGHQREHTHGHSSANQPINVVMRHINADPNADPNKPLPRLSVPPPCRPCLLLVAPATATAPEAGPPAILAVDCASAVSAPFGWTTTGVISDWATPFAGVEVLSFFPCSDALNSSTVGTNTHPWEALRRPLASATPTAYSTVSERASHLRIVAAPVLDLCSQLRLVYLKAAGHYRRGWQGGHQSMAAKDYGNNTSSVGALVSNTLPSLEKQT